MKPFNAPVKTGSFADQSLARGSVSPTPLLPTRPVGIAPRPHKIRWPLGYNTITRGRMATFGMVRRDKNGKMTIPHHGWDLYAEHGTECYAVDDGEVIRATSITGYGYTIDILLDARISGHPVYARYAHLSRFAAGIKEKERVAMGQLIGFTGNSGNAGGMTGFAQHLHFEFMKYSVPRRGSDGLQHRYDPARIYGVTPLSPAAVRDPLEKLFEPCDTSINAMLNPSVRKPGCPDIRDIQKGNQQQKGAKP